VSIVAAVSLEDELGAAAAAAGTFTGDGEHLAGVVAAEPSAGLRVYLCAYRQDEDERLSWLALDGAGEPLGDRLLVRDAVSVVGLCELAEECAGGGDVAELRRQLAELKARDDPDGIEEAQAAAEVLETTIAAPPRIATLAYLDAIGAAAAKLERALGEVGSSPFARAMQAGSAAIDELADDVERNYKRALG
jgi:hypothetical protein